MSAMSKPELKCKVLKGSQKMGAWHWLAFFFSPKSAYIQPQVIWSQPHSKQNSIKSTLICKRSWKGIWKMKIFLSMACRHGQNSLSDWGSLLFKLYHFTGYWKVKIDCSWPNTRFYKLFSSVKNTSPLTTCVLMTVWHLKLLLHGRFQGCSFSQLDQLALLIWKLKNINVWVYVYESEITRDSRIWAKFLSEKCLKL